MTPGPFVRELIARQMSMELVYEGVGDPEAIPDPDRLATIAKAATGQVMSQLAAVKEAGFENPHGDDDEKIAGAILEHWGTK